MKAIPLGKDQFALVDDDDFEWLSQHEWHVHQGKDGRCYAVRWVRKGKSYVVLKMQDAILKPPHDFIADHIGEDGLDNQRANLRLATYQNKMWKRRGVVGSSSRFKGVSFQKLSGKWVASIQTTYLGLFAMEIQAALAYNKAAIERYGEYAHINEIKECV